VDAQPGRDGGSDAAATITVKGTLIGSGVPLPYTPVSISGQAPVFTDATGNFHVEAVSVPYDLAVFISPGYFVVVRGATNPNPQIALPTNTPQSATIEGLMTSIWGGTPVGNGVLYETQSDARNDTANNLGSFGFQYDAQWNGGPQELVDVYTLEWGNNALSQPTFWTGHAKVSVQSGQTASNVTIDPSSVDAVPVTGTVTLPVGYSVEDLSAAWVPEPALYSGITFFDDKSGSTSFSFQAPKGLGTILVQASANSPPDGSDASAAVALPTGAGMAVALSIPQAPQLVLPIDNAPAVGPKDPFSWAPASGVSLITFSSIAGQNVPVGYVITAGDSCTFPDLSVFGASFPHDVSYRWQVTELTGLGPQPVDVLTAGKGLLFGIPLGGGSAASFERQFTTAP
jgi:hypothetical protein